MCSMRCKVYPFTSSSVLFCPVCHFYISAIVFLLCSSLFFSVGDFICVHILYFVSSSSFFVLPLHFFVDSIGLLLSVFCFLLGLTFGMFVSTRLGAPSSSWISFLPFLLLYWRSFPFPFSSLRYTSPPSLLVSTIYLLKMYKNINAGM